MQSATKGEQRRNRKRRSGHYTLTTNLHGSVRDKPDARLAHRLLAVAAARRGAGRRRDGTARARERAVQPRDDGRERLDEGAEPGLRGEARWPEGQRRRLAPEEHRGDSGQLDDDGPDASPCVRVSLSFSARTCFVRF